MEMYYATDELYCAVSSLFARLMAADLKAAPAVDPADRAACIARLQARDYQPATIAACLDEARKRARS